MSNGNTDNFIQKLSPEGDFLWAKNLGGSDFEYGSALYVDDSFNVYLTGFFAGVSNFDPGNSAATITSEGIHDIYILKLDSNGDFVWVNRVGSISTDRSTDINADNEGNIYVTGVFHGTVDFDSGPSVFELSATPSADNFILKLTPSGDFLWAKAFGGSGGDYNTIIEIDFDSQGNIYTAGHFEGKADFDPGVDSLFLNATGGHDAFIQKLNAAGDLIWVKQFGGKGVERTNSFAIDNSGFLYVTGSFEDTLSFDPSSNLQDLVSEGFRDIYVLKIDTSGNFIWREGIGGSEVDVPSDLVFDQQNRIFITGTFSETVDFDPGPGIDSLSAAGTDDLDDIFLLQLNTAGQFVWVGQMGGDNDDQSSSLNIDHNGILTMAGSFRGAADFEPDSGVVMVSAASHFPDAFICKFDESTVSIDNIFPELNFTIYPIPTADNLFIESTQQYPHAKIELLSMTGQALLHSSLKYPENVEWDMRSFEPGIYLVRISTGELSKMYKILKQ